MCELPCLVRLIRRHTRRRPAPFLTSSVIKFHFERSTRRGKEEGTRGAAWTRDRDFHTVVTRGKTTEVLPLITSPTIDSTPPTSPPPDLLLSFYRLSLLRAKKRIFISRRERNIRYPFIDTRTRPIRNLSIEKIFVRKMKTHGIGRGRDALSRVAERRRGP